MPSPFPGMDPYLETPALWQDFQNDLASAIREQLTPHLRPRYQARLTPRFSYESIKIGERRAALPDIGILETPFSGVASSSAVLIAPPPYHSRVEFEIPVQLQSIEIRAVDDIRLVTSLELLSPVNKRPGHDAYKAYREKRRRFLRRDVHLLEIDLLRGGERIPLHDPLPSASYFVFLSRFNEHPRVGVWPIQLQERIPIIPIPLLAPDRDVPLDLNIAIAETYERAAYDLAIDYREPPPPPALSEAEAKWLDEFLRAKGLR